MNLVKKASFVLLLVLLMAIAANVCAEGPTDPTFSRMREFKQNELRYVRMMENAENGEVRYGSGNVSITISGAKVPTNTLSFRANVNGAQDVSAYKFEWGVSDEGRDYTGYLFYPQHDDMLGKNLIQYKFYSAGEYSCFVSVFYNETWIGSDRLTFKIEDDGVHPTLEQKAAQIVNSCKVNGDAWKTALNLYDWLTHHAYYDDSLDYHGADILFLGYGVCDSYSKAYELLCKTAGIPIERAYGPGHAWNTLQLGGKWYQADATWDDAGSWLPGEGELVSGGEGHVYFCLNAAAMKQINSHSYSDGTQEGTHAADCTSMDANYYIHEGLWESFGEHSWGDYNYDTELWEEYVIPYVAQVSDEFAGGNTISERRMDTWIYYYDSNGNIQSFYLPDSIFREIMKAGLSKYSFMIDGEKIKTETGVSNDLVLTAKLKGWDIQETGTITLPGETVRILAEAFTGTAATTVVIPQGCTTIDSGAFMNSAVRTITIPASVQSIADDAFSGCGKIIMVTDNPAAVEYAAAHGILVAEP